MLDWVGEPFNAAEGAFTIDPALTEAGPSLAPFDPLLGRTRRKAADGVADAVKAELYDSEDLEYAHYGQHDPAEEPRVGASEFSRTKRKATEGLLDILRAEAPDSDEVDQLDDIKDALGQTGTTAGQQGLLAQNSVAAAGCRSLRAPNKRKKTARSIEGAAQELLEEGEGAGDGPQSSRLRRERWTVAETQALLQATELVSFSGSTLVWLGFEEVRRPQLLAEYIRRQTGVIKTADQIYNRLGKLSRTPAVKNHPRHVEMSSAEAQQTDWHARLGPDRFPRTKPVSLLDTYRTVRSKKASHPVTVSDNAGFADVKRLRLIFQGGSSASAAAAPVTGAHTHPIPLPNLEPIPPEPAEFFAREFSLTAPTPDDYFRDPESVEKQQPYSPTRRKTRKARPFVIDLSAILSSLMPGRDLTTSAHALVACGITSTSYLAELLVFDKDVLGVFLDIVGRRIELSAFEVAWTKKALEAARSSIALTT